MFEILKSFYAIDHLPPMFIVIEEIKCLEVGQHIPASCRIKLTAFQKLWVQLKILLNLISSRYKSNYFPNFLNYPIFLIYISHRPPSNARLLILFLVFVCANIAVLITFLISEVFHVFPDIYLRTSVFLSLFGDIPGRSLKFL